MRIVVTGREGQVARSLSELAPKRGHEIVTLSRPAFDLAGDIAPLIRAIEEQRPEIIVSAAAYTAVDRAEREPDLAFAVNERGAAAVARAARNLSVPVIHLSTDYVFDGTKATPYVEEDIARPASVYGASKLAGEKAVRGEHNDSAILRTSWIYSPFGSNFVKTMLRLAEDREEIRVVADQLGTPTSALDIADAILSVAANLRGSTDADKRGIFHVAGSGEASWAEFAERIFATTASLGHTSARVKPIITPDYPTEAKRPANSRLNSDRLARVHRLKLPDWRESLQQVIERLAGPTNSRDS